MTANDQEPLTSRSIYIISPRSRPSNQQPLHTTFLPSSKTAQSDTMHSVSSNEKKALKLSCLAILVIAAISSFKELIDYEDSTAQKNPDGRRYLNNEGQLERTLCTHLECRQPDPVGEIALGMYRGVAQIIHYNEYNRTLAYLMMPKAGSTTIKNAIEESKHHIKVGFLSPEDGTEATNYNPLIFTVIREPTARLVSAYSTITAREVRYGWVNGREYNFPSKPNDVTDIDLWKRHFTESMKMMLRDVKEIEWENTPSSDSHWNEHIVPQVDWIKGLNVSHIDCVWNLNEVLDKYDLPKPSKDNSYEHNSTTMPKEKYASIDLLDEETKALIAELYADDIALFESICM